MVYYPLLGPVIGLSCGSLVRAVKCRSLVDKTSVFYLGHSFKKISQFCESMRFKTQSATGLFCLIVSTEMLPFLLATIEEVGKLLSSHTLLTSLAQGGVFLIKISSYSLLHTVPIITVGFAVLLGTKCFFKSYVDHRFIDPSGHVMTACFNAALRSESLKVMASLGFHSYTYIATVVVMGCAESIWVYDTTVNYHSIVDVISGCAIGIISVQAYSQLSLVATSLLI